MTPLQKHTKNWIFLTRPLGYDPYDSLDTSYMVNTEVMELKKLKEEIVGTWLYNQEKRAGVMNGAVMPLQPERDEMGLPVL